MASRGGTATLACRALEDILSGPAVGAATKSETGNASALGLASSKSCTSRRAIRIRIREPRRGARLRSATVRVNGRPVRTVRGKRIRALIDLRGLPRGRYTVRIIATTTSGRRFSASRTYRTCAPKRAQRTRKAR